MFDKSGRLLVTHPLVGTEIVALLEALAGADKLDADAVELIDAGGHYTATDIEAALAEIITRFNANTILAANVDNTPLALTIAEQRLIGRITGGNITGLTAAQIRTLINVENGATADQTGLEIVALLEALAAAERLDADAIEIADAGSIITATDVEGALQEIQTALDIVEASKLANIVEDTTPQLGGELDAQAHTIGFTQQAATGDGTTTIDWKLGNKFFFTFGAQNDIFTFTAPTHECNLLLVLKQDGVGSRTATWPATVKWPSGTAPTLSTGANDIDIVTFYYDGTNYYGVANNDFS